MTTPRRRPIQLDATWDHDLRQLERNLKRDAPTILLGVSALKAELRDAGWPDRGGHDRKARRHIAKVCKLCKEKFTTDDGARTHQDETGHDSFEDPNRSTVTKVWQCVDCHGQFASWPEFEDHAQAYQDEDGEPHQHATLETAHHGNAGRAHNDPAGEAAMQLWDKHGDLDSMQDHLRSIVTSLRALKLITGRHVPDGDKRTEPACWKSQCDQRVESRVLSDGSVSYRGMTCIGGVWVARAGEEPTCARHRKATSRDSTAGTT